MNRADGLDSPFVPERVEELTAVWLEEALGLGSIVDLRIRPHGMGNAAQTVRIEVDWARPDGQPASFVAKLVSPEPATRRFARATRAYEVEACFYRDLAPALDARVPHCYWSGYDAETDVGAVLLEDVCGGTVGDQLVGCAPDEASRALVQLAAVAGVRWGDPALERMGWFNRYPAGDGLRLRLHAALPSFLGRYSGRLSGDVERLVLRFVDRADGYDRKGRTGPRTICHGDFRNENLIFGPDRVCILDWQGVQLGAGLYDVAYFLGTAVQTATRRAHETELVHDYWKSLQTFGVQLGFDDCWHAYRHHAFSGVSLALLASVIALDERADRLLLAIAERSGQMALDLDSESLLADPVH